MLKHNLCLVPTPSVYAQGQYIFKLYITGHMETFIVGDDGLLFVGGDSFLLDVFGPTIIGKAWVGCSIDEVLAQSFWRMKRKNLSANAKGGICCTAIYGAVLQGKWLCRIRFWNCVCNRSLERNEMCQLKKMKWGLFIL